jgi:CHASE2 domain-containing sensor protein
MATARPRLFLSYRRVDSEGSAGRLADALVHQFGRDRVFLDSQKIPFGDDFLRVIETEIARADIVLAIIGKGWLDAANDRGRRLDQADDPVRHELQIALASGRRLVPVLVDGASLPPPEDLPASIAELPRRQTATLRNAAFAEDFDILVDELLGRPRGTLRTEADHLRRLVAGARGAAFVVPAVALCAAVAAWAGLFDWLHLDTHVQRALLAQAPAAGAGPVLIAAIDAETERRLSRTWPKKRAEWRRDHATLVDHAAAAGARAVVFDLAFDCLDRDDPCDPELAPLAAAARRAAARTPSMTVVFGVRHPGDVDGAKLSGALRGTGRNGHVCLFDRGDGALWSVPLGVLIADAGRDEVVALRPTPALSLAALLPGPLRGADVARRTLVADGPIGGPPLAFSTVERRRESLRKCSLIAEGELAATLLLRPAPPGYWHAEGRRVPYAALVAPAATAAGAALAGRIVLVGVTAEADVFGVQRERGVTNVHGVELHADAIAALASGRVPQLATAGVQLGTSLATALAGVAIVLGVPRGWRRPAAAALLGAAWLAACAALARHDLLLNPAYDLAALLLSAGAMLALLRIARRFPVRRSPT